MSFRRIITSIALIFLLLVPADFAFAQTATPTRTPTPTPTPDRRGLIPVGTIELYGGASAPNSAWLVCDGHAEYRSAYPDLFAVIGTTYGAGDGSTTFNLPDFRGRIPLGVGSGLSLTTRTLGSMLGAETHTLTITEMPPHTHTVPMSTGGNGNTGGVSVRIPSGSTTSSSTGGGAAFNIMNPALVVGYYIFSGENLSFTAADIQVTVVIVFPSHTPTFTPTPTLTSTAGPSPTPTATATMTPQIETSYEVNGESVIVRNEVTPGDAALVGLLAILVGLKLVELFRKARS